MRSVVRRAIVLAMVLSVGESAEAQIGTSQPSASIELVGTSGQRRMLTVEDALGMTSEGRWRHTCSSKPRMVIE